MQYHPTDIPFDISEEAMYLAHFETSLNKWLEVPTTVNTDKYLVIAQLNQFSTFTVLHDRIQFGCYETYPYPHKTTTAANEVEENDIGKKTPSFEIISSLTVLALLSLTIIYNDVKKQHDLVSHKFSQKNHKDSLVSLVCFTGCVYI